MVKISGVYQGNLHCRSVHGPSGGVLFTDAPKDNGGSGSAYSPTDLVATALVTCIVTTLALAVEEQGVPLRGLSYEVKKEMSTEPPRRIARLAVMISIPRRQTPELAALVEKAVKKCPVQQSLSPATEVPVTVRWLGE